MAGFYSARSGTIPPLPWPTFAPPLSLEGILPNRLGLKVLEDFGSFVLFKSGFAIHDGMALEQTVWRQASLSKEPYGRRNMLLYFEHDNVDAAFENIAPHVELIHPVERQAWGQRVFRFYDPDRHAVEVGEPQNLTVGS